MTELRDLKDLTVHDGKLQVNYLPCFKNSLKNALSEFTFQEKSSFLETWVKQFTSGGWWTYSVQGLGFGRLHIRFFVRDDTCTFCYVLVSAMQGYLAHAGNMLREISASDAS